MNNLVIGFHEPQIPSRVWEGRRHICSAGIRGFPLPKGNRDADERRFVNIIIQRFPEFYLFRLRTRMMRIITDIYYPRVSASSAQSAFHSIKQMDQISEFICVHLRLIFHNYSLIESSSMHGGQL